MEKNETAASFILNRDLSKARQIERMGGNIKKKKKKKKKWMQPYYDCSCEDNHKMGSGSETFLATDQAGLLRHRPPLSHYICEGEWILPDSLYRKRPQPSSHRVCSNRRELGRKHSGAIKPSSIRQSVGLSARPITIESQKHRFQTWERSK